MKQEPKRVIDWCIVIIIMIIVLGCVVMLVDVQRNQVNEFCQNKTGFFYMGDMIVDCNRTLSPPLPLQK